MKRLILSLVVIFAATLAFSQSISDLKLKGKKEKDSKSSGDITIIPGANQFDRIQAFYDAFTTVSVYKFYKYDQIEKYKSEGSLKRDEFFKDVKRNDKNQITAFTVPGLEVEQTFVANDPDFPRWFKGERGTLYVVGKYALYRNGVPMTTTDEVDKIDYYSPQSFIISGDGSVVKGVKLPEWKQMLKDYLNDIKASYDAHLLNKKNMAEQAEKEKRAKFTTQGKNLTSIKLITDKTTLKQGDFCDFEVVAVFKDGSEISSKSGLYLDEFVIDVAGLPEKYFSFSNNRQDLPVLGSTRFTVPMDAAVKGDQIILNVSSKFYPSVKANKTFAMDYSATFIKLDEYKGTSDKIMCSRFHFANSRIELKMVKHGVTKQDLIELKWIDLSSGRVVVNIRYLPSAQVSVNVTGANGWSNSKCNPTDTHGTSGGNVKLVIDPSVTSYNLDILNDGGRGSGALSLDGSPGKVEKVTQKVPW
ncbi:MAG: hypothetical protein ACK40M_10500 [Flavobacteriales bacterium]